MNATVEIHSSVVVHLFFLHVLLDLAPVFFPFPFCFLDAQMRSRSGVSEIRMAQPPTIEPTRSTSRLEQPQQHSDTPTSVVLAAPLPHLTGNSQNNSQHDDVIVPSPPLPAPAPTVPPQQTRRRRRPPHRRLLTYLTSPIRPSHFAELELLLLTFSTGMQDATSFPDYRCFASNQTGNTVMLALSLTIPRAKTANLFVTPNIAVSLPLFLTGAYLTGQLGQCGRIVPNRLSRWWLLLLNAVQTAMVFAAAGLQYVYGVQLTGGVTLGVIALLAFASGSQVVISRSLRMTEISTAMATAAYVDLLVDPALLRWRNNRPRNRRAGFLLALVAGCFVGAELYASHGSAFTLMVSAGGKAVVTAMFLFNPSGGVGEEREEKRLRETVGGGDGGIV